MSFQEIFLLLIPHLGCEIFMMVYVGAVWILAIIILPKDPKLLSIIFISYTLALILICYFWFCVISLFLKLVNRKDQNKYAEIGEQLEDNDQQIGWNV